MMSAISKEIFQIALSQVNYVYSSMKESRLAYSETGLLVYTENECSV